MKNLTFSIILLFPLFIHAQPVSVKKVDNSANFPMITWFTVGKIDTTAFQIFRASLKEKVFKEIQTVNSTNPAQKESDTNFFYVTDTTLVKKAIYLYYITIKRSGKEVVSETAMGHNFGYIPSPQVVEFIATPVTDRKAVTLSWKLTYPKMVSSMTLYRSLQYDTGYRKIVDLVPDMATFTDVAPKANEPMFYILVVHTYFGRNITSVRIPAFATFAEKPIKPVNIHGTYRNDSIILNWSNVGKNIIGYRVYRSIAGKPYFLINDMGNGTAEKVVFTDAGDDVKNSVNLSYYIKNVSDGYVESDNSDTLSFYLADHEPVLPPAVIDNITDDNDNVKLLWVQPKKGLTTGYNIYLIVPQGDTLLLNKKVLTQNYFTDTVYRKQGKYRYEIEGVGINNKTSMLRTSATVFRYTPQIHVIIDLKNGPGGIIVSWKHPLNKNIDKLILYKQTETGQPVILKTYSPAIDSSFTDKSVVKGKVYQYILKAKMVDGQAVTVNEGVQINY